MAKMRDNNLDLNTKHCISLKSLPKGENGKSGGRRRTAALRLFFLDYRRRSHPSNCETVFELRRRIVGSTIADRMEQAVSFPVRWRGSEEQ